MPEINGYVDTRCETSLNGCTSEHLNVHLVQEEGTSTTSVMSQNAVAEALNGKQDELVSGVNIKTINNESLLGAGNIDIQVGGTDDYEDLNNKPKINGVELIGNKTADDVNVAHKVHTHTAAEVSGLADVATSGDYSDLSNKPTIPIVPANLSEFNNDVGYITASQVPAQVNADWDAESGAAEILNKPTIPSKTSDLTNDSGYVDGSYHDPTKQDTLVSGTNIKTINGKSLIGSGDIAISGKTDYDFNMNHAGAKSGSFTATYASSTRGYIDITTAANIAIAFDVNNQADNYLLIKNTGASDIAVTLSSVTYKGIVPTNVVTPDDGISVKAGKYVEISIIASSILAVVTSSNNLA